MTDQSQNTQNNTPVEAYQAYCAASRQLCKLRQQVETMHINSLKAMRGNVERLEWDRESEYDDAGGYYNYATDVRLVVKGKDDLYIRSLSELLDYEYIDELESLRDAGIEIPASELLSNMDNEALENLYLDSVCQYAGIPPEYGKMFYTMVFDFVEDNITHYGLLLDSLPTQ